MSKSLFISCQKATELVEKKLLGMASRKELFKLWFHEKMCAICLNYEKQSTFLSQALGRLSKKCPESQLDQVVKEKIIREVKEKT